MRRVLTVGFFDNVTEAENEIDKIMDGLLDEEREKAEVSYSFDPRDMMYKVIIAIEE